MADPALKLNVGGTVPLEVLYIKRPADAELPQALGRGELCYVLAPRQMGKSSLRLRAQRDLEGRRVRCASVDLTTIGAKEDSAADWYYSLVDGIRKGLGLRDPAEFWQAHGQGTAVQGFVDYIKEEVAARLGGPAVIFIDELDGLLALRSVSRDDFLAAVRALYNARADAPDLRRVTFCLLGAALPGDLIEDERRTPFNVGRGIVLEDFRRQDLATLEAALGPAVLDAVYGWTSGHPYMTMKLCEALLNREAVPADEVDEEVRRLFLKKGRVREQSLAYAEKHFERKAEGGRVDQMLWQYGRLVAGQRIEALGQDPVQGALVLTGLVSERQGVLQVRNRVLAEVFDGAWVKRQQAERLFTGPLQRWLEGGRGREHLLKGAELEAALQWSNGRGDIAPEERDFLLASQATEGEGRRAAVQRRLDWVLGGAFLVALVLIGFLALQTREARRQEREAQRLAASEKAAKQQAETEKRLAEQRAASEAAAKQQAKEAQRLAEQRAASEAAAKHQAQKAEKRAEVQQQQAESAARTEKSLRAAAQAAKPGQLMPALVAGMQAVAPEMRSRHFVTQNWEGVVAATRQAVRSVVLEGHEGRIFSVAYSPDGRRIVTGSADHTARVWDAATGKALSTLQGHAESVQAVAYSPDGRRILTGSNDRTVRVWDTATGKVLLTLQGHADAVFSVAYSPDGRRILTGSNDRTVRVWDAATGKALLTIQGRADAVFSAAYSPDGHRIITGSGICTVQVWDAATGKPLLTVRECAPKGLADNAWSVAYSPDGQRMIAGSDGNTVRVWDAATGKTLFTMEGFHVAYSPDGRRIVTNGAENTALVWDEHTGRVGDATSPFFLNHALFTLQGHTEIVTSVAYSPDGRSIVTGSSDGTARVWDVATGMILVTRKVNAVRVNSNEEARSPDGRRMVTVGLDNTARVLDISTRQTLLTLQGHSKSITSVAYSPDGHRIVTGSLDNTARVWDAATGNALLIMEWDSINKNDVSNHIHSVAYSLDGRHIIIGSLVKETIYPARNEDYYAFGCQVLRTLRDYPGISEDDLTQVLSACPIQ